MDGCIESDQLRIIISIDYGTTFSAASYAVLNDKKKLSINDVYWPDSENQVKTQMAWDDDAKLLLCGCDVDKAIDGGRIDDSEVINLVKLALYERGEKTEPFRLALNRQLQSLKSKRGSGYGIVDLISEYLRYLKAHILYKIRNARGAEVVAGAKLEYIVSVPALWKLHHLDMMVKAAEKAGMACPRLVSEPEAAAITCHYKDYVKQPKLEGDLSQEGRTPEGFLTLDSGGGTVDIITYVAEMKNLREGARGIGGIHGSATLDWDFRDFIGGHLQRDFQSIIQDLEMSDCEAAEQEVIDLAVASFEKNKKYFDGGDLTINISGKGKKRARPIVIPSAYIRQIFDGRLAKIVQMTREQISAFNENNASLGIKILYILFVGGLSKSEYALERLQAEFASEGIEIRTHEESSVLISQGAILRVLHQDSMGEFYLRCGYGVIWDEEYDRKRHTERSNRKVHGKRKIRHDEHDGLPIVMKRNGMFCFPGEMVRAGTKKTVRGWFAIPTRGGDIKVFQRMCRTEHATRNGLAIKDPRNDIEEIEPLVFTIPGNAINGFQVYNRRKGKNYEGFEWDIVMTIDNPRGTFEMIIPDGGVFQADGSCGGKFKSYKANIHLASTVFATRSSTKNVVMEELEELEE